MCEGETGDDEEGKKKKKEERTESVSSFPQKLQDELQESNTVKSFFHGSLLLPIQKGGEQHRRLQHIKILMCCCGFTVYSMALLWCAAAA